MVGVVLYCFALNDWEWRLRRQIKRLDTSGLYEGADELYLLVSDIENSNEDLVKEIIADYPKYNLKHYTYNNCEAEALSLVDDLCRQNDDYKVLYFHTKGVFNKYKNFLTKEIDELKVNGVNSWVEMMEYFVVDKWRVCVQKLDTYDTVGVANNGNWWWGNFWWTKSSHVKKNTVFRDFYGGSRWHCEGWLHDANSDKENIKYYEMYKYTFDGHYTIIPSYLYNGEDISGIEFDIIDAKFGYFLEQRDEGRGLMTEEDKVFDVTEQIKDSVKKTNYKRITNDWSKYDFDSEFSNRFGSTLFCTLQKTLRVRFRTNIDPENEYVISSFMYHFLNIGYKE